MPPAVRGKTMFRRGDTAPVFGAALIAGLFHHAACRASARLPHLFDTVAALESSRPAACRETCAHAASATREPRRAGADYWAVEQLGRRTILRPAPSPGGRQVRPACPCCPAAERTALVACSCARTRRAARSASAAVGDSTRRRPVYDGRTVPKSTRAGHRTTLLQGVRNVAASVSSNNKGLPFQRCTGRRLRPRPVARCSYRSRRESAARQELARAAPTFPHYMSGMFGMLTRASMVVLAVLASRGHRQRAIRPPEPIGQGGLRPLQRRRSTTPATPDHRPRVGPISTIPNRVIVEAAGHRPVQGQALKRRTLCSADAEPACARRCRRTRVRSRTYLMSKPLTSRIALRLPGASRGIGYATALALAKLGRAPISWRRPARPAGSKSSTTQSRAEGGTATLVPLELRDTDGILRLAAARNERYGKLDMPVGNAALGATSSPLDHFEPKEWDTVIAVNVTANWHLIRSMDPLLKRSDCRPRGVSHLGRRRQCRARLSRALCGEQGRARDTRPHLRGRDRVDARPPSTCSTPARRGDAHARRGDARRRPDDVAAARSGCGQNHATVFTGLQRNRQALRLPDRKACLVPSAGVTEPQSAHSHRRLEPDLAIGERRVNETSPNSASPPNSALSPKKASSSRSLATAADHRAAVARPAARGLGRPHEPRRRNLRRQASDLNSLISSFRSYYASNVVGRVLLRRTARCGAAHNYEAIPAQIPIPATLSLELGKVIRRWSSRTSPNRFVSDYPFANRAALSSTRSRPDALAALRKIRRSRSSPRHSTLFNDTVRLIAPVTMGAACVSCRNAHPESPKRDCEGRRRARHPRR